MMEARNSTNHRLAPMVTTPLVKKRKPRFDADNVLGRGSRDLHRFRRLCQGDWVLDGSSSTQALCFTPSFHAHVPPQRHAGRRVNATAGPPLKCHVKTFGKPHLKLQPVRIEEMHHGPTRLSVRWGLSCVPPISPRLDPSLWTRLFEILRRPKSASTCALKVKNTWTGPWPGLMVWFGGFMKHRVWLALIIWGWPTPYPGKFKPVEFRISTAAWLEPNHDAIIARVDRRIADATQLALKHAEQLQVSNCKLFQGNRC